MDSRLLVFHETRIVACGVAVCTAAMIGLFFLMGRYDSSVLLGGITGALISIGNFLWMAFCASMAADKARQQDVQGGRMLIRNSYLLRLAVLFTVLFLCAKSGLFHPVALALPLVFVRPVLTLAAFFRRKGAGGT